MSPEEQHADAVEAAREWTALQRERYASGGWLSGGCADDAQPGTFVVFEDRPADSTEPPVVREGNVIWVDAARMPARRWSLRQVARRLLAAYTAVADAMQGIRSDGHRPHR